MIAEAPSFLQKIFNHLRCQFRERYISQAGDDMVLKYIVVCLKKARKSRALDRMLEVSIPDEVYEALERQMETDA